MARSTTSWREVGFDEAFQRLKLKAFEIPTKDYQVAGTYPIIDQGDGAVAGYIDREDPISDVPFIVFGDHTTIVKYVDQPCFIGSQGVVPLKARECYDPYFLYLMLGRTRIPALGYSRHFRELENKTFPLPPLVEQRKIAEILRTWDEAIEAAEAELKAKQERKRGLMQKLLNPSDDGAGAVRMVSKSTVQLGDICKPQQWATIGSSELTESGYRVHGANCFIGYYSEANHASDVVAVSCRGENTGNVIYIPGPSYVTGNAMCLDDLDESKADARWLCEFLKLRGLRDIISGSAQPQIIQKDLARVKIPLPPLAEQRKIAQVLQSEDAAIDSLKVKADLLRAQKRGLMQKLMTGEIRVAA